MGQNYWNVVIFGDSQETKERSIEVETKIVITSTNLGNPQHKQNQKKKHSHKQMIKQHKQEPHQYHEQEQKDEWEQQQI